MSARDRRAILIGAVLIGLAVLYRVALTPLFDQWGQARADVTAQAAMLDQFEGKLERRSDIRKRLEPRYGPGVHQSLSTADEARVAFPRSVQQAIQQGGAATKQVEVQGLRRLRDLPGVELLSLRVLVTCKPDAIPGIFRELSQAELPTVVESVNLRMPNRGQRQKWEATLVVSTPTLAGRGNP
ncbi:MAG: hypothetical protein AAGH99_12610 [Planctomycetota bacterium]